MQNENSAVQVNLSPEYWRQMKTIQTSFSFAFLNSALDYKKRGQHIKILEIKPCKVPFYSYVIYHIGILISINVELI